MEIPYHTHKCALNKDTNGKSCQRCFKHYVVALIAAVILVLISVQPSRAQTDLDWRDYFKRTYREGLSENLSYLSRGEWCLVVAPLTGNWPTSQPPIGWEYSTDQVIDLEKCWTGVSYAAIIISGIGGRLSNWTGKTALFLNKPVQWILDSLLAKGYSKEFVVGLPILIAAIVGAKIEPKDYFKYDVATLMDFIQGMLNRCMNLGYTFPTLTDIETLLTKPHYFIDSPTDPLGFTFGRSCSRDAAKLWLSSWADRGYKTCADCCRVKLTKAMSSLRDVDDALSQGNACLAICDANFNPSACARYRENAECGYDPCGDKIGDCPSGTSCNPATRKCDSNHCCGIGDKCTKGPGCDLSTGRCRQPETTSRGSSSSASGGSSSSASGGSSSSASASSSSSAPSAPCPEPWNTLANEYQCGLQDPATCLESCGDSLERDSEFLKLPKHEQISCVTLCPQP